MNVTCLLMFWVCMVGWGGDGGGGADGCQGV